MSEPPVPPAPDEGHDMPDARSAQGSTGAPGQPTEDGSGINPYGDVDPYGDTPNDPDRHEFRSGESSPSGVDRFGGDSDRAHPDGQFQPLRDVSSAAPGARSGYPPPWSTPTDNQTPPIRLGTENERSITEPHEAITAYQVSRRRGPVVAVIVAAVVIAVVLVFLASRPPEVQPQAMPTPTSTAPASPTTPEPAGSASVTNSIPVSTRTFQGTWNVDSSTWDARGVTVQMTLKASQGTLTYSFFSLDNSTTKEYRASGDMASGTISATRTQQGQIRLDKPRGDTTLILADQAGRQITALMIPA